MARKEPCHPLRVCLTILALLAPALLAGYVAPADGEPDQTLWSQFARNERHTGEGPPVERGLKERNLTDPIRTWDHGDGDGSGDYNYVISWSTTVGNFSANMEKPEEYDRTVQHIVYVAAKDTGNGWQTKLVIRDGGSGDLMWEQLLGKMRDNAGNLISDNHAQFKRSGMPTPSLADFDGDGKLEIVAARTEGNVTFFEPKISYNAATSSYNVGGDTWQGSYTYDARFSMVRTSPALVDLNNDNRLDVVFSGLYNDGNNYISAKLVAVQGSTGTELFAPKTFSGNTEISSPAVLDKAPNHNLFVTTYDDDLGELNVWAVWQDGTPVSGWYPHNNKWQIRDPAEGDSDNHFLLPSIVIANLTSDEGEEILVPIPAPSASGDGKLLVYEQGGQRAQGWSSPATVKGDIDGTPAVGDIDGDGKAEIVVISWWDPGVTQNEKFRVTAFNGEDRSIRWETDESELDTADPSTFDDGEHAVASPILVDFTQDNRLDVLIAVTPEVIGLKGTNGRGAGSEADYFRYRLPNRSDTNRLFDSPASGDVDGDGMVDFIVSGSVYSANLTDQTLKAKDIVFTDQAGQPLTEAEEGEPVDIAITVRNEGNRDAKQVNITVWEEKAGADEELPGSPFFKDIDGNSAVDLKVEDWSPSQTGDVRLWVRVRIEPNKNEEVRYDNNNRSKLIHIWPSYGVEQEVTSNATQAGKPGENVTFALNVTNLGRRNDNFTLTLYWQTGENWANNSAAIALDNLTSNETRAFELNVTLPEAVEEAQAGDYGLRLRATSQGNSSRYHEVNLTLVVSQVHGLRVVPREEGLPFIPDYTRLFTFDLTNKGNVQETFELQVFNEVESNWTVTDFPGQVVVNPGQTTPVAVEVLSPGFNAGGQSTQYGEEFEVPVVVETSDGSRKAYVNFTATMQQALIYPMAQSVDPGANASYTLQLYNLNMTGANQTLELVVKNRTRWNYGFEDDRENVTLPGYGSASLRFNVTVPGNAKANQKAFHNLSVRGAEPGWEDLLRVTTTANPLEGLRLKPTAGYKEFLHVQRGERVSINLQATNFEAEPLEATLSVVKPAPFPFSQGWDYHFGADEGEQTWTRELGSNGTRSVTFHIDVSNNSTEGSRLFLVLRLEASGGEFAAELPVTLIVEQDYRVNLTGSAAVEPLLANISQKFVFILTNTGNGDDSFKVESNFSVPEWQLGSVEGLYPLSAGESRPLEVWIRPDANLTVGDRFELKLTASSQEGHSKGVFPSENWTLALEGSSWRLESGASRSGEPNATASYSFRVANSQDEPVRFFFELSETVEDWSHNLTSTTVAVEEDELYRGQRLPSILLGPGQNAEATLNLVIPAGQTVGDYPFTLALRPHVGSGLPDQSEGLEVTVEQVYGHTLRVTTPEPVERGAQVTVRATLTNTGNGPDTYALAADTLEATGWTLMVDEILIALNPQEQREVTFTLRVSNQTLEALGPPERYTLGVAAVSQGAPTGQPGREVAVLFNVTVVAEYDFELDFTKPTTQEGEFGTPVYFTFNVTNAGNSADTYDFAVTFSQVTATLLKAELSLDPLQSGKNHVKVELPSATAEGPWTLTLEATSRTDSQVNLSQVLIVTKPTVTLNLRFVDAYLKPENPTAGQQVEVWVTVKAVGNTASGVKVTVTLDGRLLTNKTISFIGQGDEKVVQVAIFKAAVGNHDLELEIDPEETLEETNDQDNTETIKFSVTEPAGSGWLWLLLVLALVMVAGLGYYTYQRRQVLGSEIPSEGGGVAISSTGEGFPLILNCTGCGVKIKVNKPGGYRCPACKTIGRVDEQGQVVEEGAKPEVKEIAESQAQAPETPAQPQPIAFPAVVACAGCQSQIQVAQAGPNRCPTCQAVVEVAVTGQVTLWEGETGGRTLPSPESAPSPEAPSEPEPAPAAEPSASQPEAPPAAPEPVEFPLIIRCKGCEAKVRVKEPGKFRCPACKTTSHVDEEGRREGEPAAKTAPLSVACPQCQARIKVPKPGKFRCPACRTVSTVNAKGRVEPPAPAPEEGLDWEEEEKEADEKEAPTEPQSERPPESPPEAPTPPDPTPAPTSPAPAPVQTEAAPSPAGAPEAVVELFSTHLKLTPTEAAQLYNRGFTSLRSIKAASQAKLMAAMVPPLTTTQVKRLRMDVRFLDLEGLEGPEPAPQPVEEAATPPASPPPAAETPAPPSLSEDEIPTGPFEGGCPACGSMVEVAQPGLFRCPACMAVSELEADGTVTLQEAPETQAQPEESAATAGSGVRANCGACGTPVQVAQAGMFRCPACLAVSELSVEGQVTLREAPPTPETTPATTPAPETPAPAPEEGPISAACPSCGAHVKVPQPGKFRCPGCKAISRLAADGKVDLVKGPPEPKEEAEEEWEVEAASDDENKKQKREEKDSESASKAATKAVSRGPPIGGI